MMHQPSRQHGDAVTIIILGEMGMMYAFVFPSECPLAAICVLTNYSTVKFTLADYILY